MNQTRTSLVILALVGLCALPRLPGQESRPNPAEATTRPVTAADREAARKLLDRAIASQLGGLERGSVTSFQGEFDFRFFREEGNLVGSYGQAWSFDSQKRFHFRRTLTTDLSRKVVTLVCNGRDEIFGVDAKGRTIAKNRAEDEGDRDAIRTEKRSARRLYELFVLSELDVDPESLELVSAGEMLKLAIGANSDFAQEVKVVTLRTRGGKKVKLWFHDGKKSCDLVQAEVSDPNDPRVEKAPDGSELVVPEVFQMLGHWPIKLPDGEHAIRFPLRMRYLIGKTPVIEITCDYPQDIRLNSIDAKLRHKLFEPEE